MIYVILHRELITCDCGKTHEVYLFDSILHGRKEFLAWCTLMNLTIEGIGLVNKYGTIAYKFDVEEQA